MEKKPPTEILIDRLKDDIDENLRLTSRPIFNPMTQNTTSREERFEKEFNSKFGFGIWDSRATDKETMLRTHRDEGIFSSDVLEHSKSFFRKEINSLLDELLSEVEGMRKKELWLSRTYYPEELVNRNVAPIYNTALEDVRAIINNKKLK